mgnify:CR=1 FL=1
MRKEVNTKPADAIKLDYQGETVGYRLVVSGLVLDMLKEDYMEVAKSIPGQAISHNKKLSMVMDSNGTLRTYNENGAEECENWLDALRRIPENVICGEKVYSGVEGLSDQSKNGLYVSRDILNTLKLYNYKMRFYLLPRPFIKRDKNSVLCKEIYYINFVTLYETSMFLSNFLKVSGFCMSEETIRDIRNAGVSANFSGSTSTTMVLSAVTGCRGNSPRDGFKEFILKGTIRDTMGKSSFHAYISICYRLIGKIPVVRLAIDYDYAGEDN